MNAEPRLLWTPSPEFSARAQLSRFRDWLKEREGFYAPDYHSLWQWSVDHSALFWERLAEYFEIQFHQPYQEVRSADPMPGTRWFSGSTLNYAEHLFRYSNSDTPALLFQSEHRPMQAWTWAELEGQASALRRFLQDSGVGIGDRVVAFLPNIPEASAAFIASASLGAIWSSCSPDFGVGSVVDRFRQIEPKVLFAVDGYYYNGKAFPKMEAVAALREALPSLERVVVLPYLEEQPDFSRVAGALSWEEATLDKDQPLRFDPVPFEHPLWVLYSSGTTGLPKAITHSHGGVLLEHYKYMAFHNDVHPGERFFWFTTTGWMMWNFLQASLLMGATAVLYDGSPAYPDLHCLWSLVEKAGIQHFGTSAPFLVACMKQELKPGSTYDLSALRSIGSTGAPLPPEAFAWVYEEVKSDLWLCSMSGGTDVCTAFVGGCPWLPVYLGEIQCRALGCALYAFDEEGKAVAGEVGEMVITQPMPSMPVFFWNDPDQQRYLGSYFEDYPGIWRHGDWVEITPRDGLIIYGRSDATLNRQGVRIGTAEIYQALNAIREISDSLIVNLELEGGQHYMPLFVVLEKDQQLDEQLEKRIRQVLRETYSPRHVPDEIIAIAEIPYTISGKKLEAPVKKILLGRPAEKAANRDALRNPDALQFFVDFARQIPGRGAATSR